MITKKVLRYYSECGRGFWKKSACLTHEINCKCWGNPKNKACKTCKYGKYIHENQGIYDGYEMQDYWIHYYKCQNPEIANEEHYGAWEGIDYISANCQKWESK